MTKQSKQDGHVPITVINQLNEYTAGGFVLFYYNSETGAPEQIMTFDSPAHCLGLQKHISDWLTALQDLSIENEKINIVSSYRSDEEDNSDVI
jgi:hypothetical protein